MATSLKSKMQEREFGELPFFDKVFIENEAIKSHRTTWRRKKQEK